MNWHICHIDDEVAKAIAAEEEGADTLMELFAGGNVSFGNGIRAGAIHDSHDRAQMAEMIINCELAEKKREQEKRAGLARRDMQGMEVFMEDIRGDKISQDKEL